MSQDKLELAHKAAQGSIVLLKNENNVLPLDKKSAKRVALIGPFVDERESLNGEWAMKGDRKKSVTLREGLNAKYAGSNVKFNYAEGTKLPLLDRRTQKITPVNSADQKRFCPSCSSRSQQRCDFGSNGRKLSLVGRSSQPYRYYFTRKSARNC